MDYIGTDDWIVRSWTLRYSDSARTSSRKTHPSQLIEITSAQLLAVISMRTLREMMHDAFTSHYHTRALYVDGERKCVVARPTNEEDIRVDYDILLGCDGIRSIVRNAFMNNHRDFEFELKGTFSYGKSVHVPLPMMA
eukprot:scaffold25425_cov129-Skeletonema_dohrnii-CCMP3373.AAC.2